MEDKYSDPHIVTNLKNIRNIINPLRV